MGRKYRGQKQKWFAYRFTGDDSEIAITPPPGLQAEFDEWRWMPAGELLDLIVPFKRDVYRQVLRNSRPMPGPKAGKPLDPAS